VQLIKTRTADELSVLTSMTLNDPEVQKQQHFSEFFAISGYSEYFDSELSRN